MNIPLTEIAKKSGLDRGYVRTILSDPKCNPTIKSLTKICDVLELSITEVLDSSKETEVSSKR